MMPLARTLIRRGIDAHTKTSDLPLHLHLLRRKRTKKVTKAVEAVTVEVDVREGSIPMAAGILINQEESGARRNPKEVQNLIAVIAIRTAAAAAAAAVVTVITLVVAVAVAVAVVTEIRSRSKSSRGIFRTPYLS